MSYQPLSLQYQTAQCIVEKNIENQILTPACKDYVALLKAGKNYFNTAKLSIILSTPHFQDVLQEYYQKSKTDKQKEIFNVALKKLTEYAVVFSNLAVLELLLEYNTENANLVIDKKNHSLLMYTAHNPTDLEIAKLLLERGANSQACDNQQETVLMHAAQVNNKKLLKLLLQKTNNINALDFMSGSALECATQSNAQENVLYLLKKGATIDDEPLLWPIIRNNIFLIKEFMNRGAKTNASPRYLRTAIRERNLEALQFLCENGANPNLIDMHENTAIIYAAKQPNAIAMLQVLLNHNAAINHQNHKGKTALHKAAKRAYTDTVKFLCEHGADINLKDNAAQLPVDAAIQMAKLPIDIEWLNRIERVVDYLLTVHAKEKTFNYLQSFDKKFSFYVYKKDYVEVPPFLQIKDHTMKIENAWIQFIKAIQTDNVEKVQHYLDTGQSINKIINPSDKLTILHIAATWNSKKIITLALDHNANINLKDNHNQTPLIRARLNNAHEAEELIKQAIRNNILKQLSKN